MIQRCGVLRWILCLLACCPSGAAVAATLDIRVLDSAVADATAAKISGGALESQFRSGSLRESASRGDVLWLRIQSHADLDPGVIPVLVVHAGMLHKVRVYAAGGASEQPLAAAAHAPEFAGARDTAFILPAADRPVYVRVVPPGPGHGTPRFSTSTLDKFLEESAARTRMITLAFGGLVAMHMAA